MQMQTEHRDLPKIKCVNNNRTEYEWVNSAVNFIRGFGNQTKILKNVNW